MMQCSLRRSKATRPGSDQEGAFAIGPSLLVAVLVFVGAEASNEKLAHTSVAIVRFTLCVLLVGCALGASVGERIEAVPSSTVVDPLV